MYGDIFAPPSGHRLFEAAHGHILHQDDHPPMPPSLPPQGTDSTAPHSFLATAASDSVKLAYKHVRPSTAFTAWKQEQGIAAELFACTTLWSSTKTAPITLSKGASTHTPNPQT